MCVCVCVCVCVCMCVCILKANMVEEASLEFRFRIIDETRNYPLDELKHDKLIS